MKYLLDTHVAIWWLFQDRKLDKDHARILERIERARDEVGLSAISLWEIAKLVELGRLELPRAIDESFAQLEGHAALTILPLTGRVAIESTYVGARLRGDPADQLIVATARCHGLTLLTADRKLIESGVVAVA
jgi:PIN domain nuclease of toxin-antitoxin system